MALGLPCSHRRLFCLSSLFMKLSVESDNLDTKLSFMSDNLPITALILRIKDCNS